MVKNDKFRMKFVIGYSSNLKTCLSCECAVPDFIYTETPM